MCMSQAQKKVKEILEQHYKIIMEKNCSGVYRRHHCKQYYVSINSRDDFHKLCNIFKTTYGEPKGKFLTALIANWVRPDLTLEVVVMTRNPPEAIITIREPHKNLM